MKGYRFISKISGGIVGGIGLFYGGYLYGSHSAIKKLEKPQSWEDLPQQSRYRLFDAATQQITWKELGRDRARQLMPDILDAAQIPHGDMAIPSKTVHSGRHIISQWQRSAVGSCVMVLGKDDDGDLCLAVGNQRGLLRHPQGYMEVGLPEEDLTGLRVKNASRINAKTGELISMDHSIEDNAVREVYEEIGLTISKDQLRLLRIKSADRNNPVCIEAHYCVLLNETPLLKTINEEFADDDLSKPRWVKIENIVSREGKYYSSATSLPFDHTTITQLNTALQAIGHTELNVCNSHEFDSHAFRP